MLQHNSKVFSTLIQTAVDPQSVNISSIFKQPPPPAREEVVSSRHQVGLVCMLISFIIRFLPLSTIMNKPIVFVENKIVFAGGMYFMMSQFQLFRPILKSLAY